MVLRIATCAGENFIQFRHIIDDRIVKSHRERHITNLCLPARHAGGCRHGMPATAGGKRKVKKSDASFAAVQKVKE